MGIKRIIVVQNINQSKQLVLLALKHVAEQKALAIKKII